MNTLTSLIKYAFVIANGLVFIIMVLGPYAHDWLGFDKHKPKRYDPAHSRWTYQFRRWRIRARKRSLAQQYNKSGFPPADAILLFLAAISLYVFGSLILS